MKQICDFILKLNKEKKLAIIINMTTINENVIDIIVGNNNEIQQNLYRTVSEVQSCPRSHSSRYLCLRH